MPSPSEQPDREPQEPASDQPIGGLTRQSRPDLLGWLSSLLVHCALFATLAALTFPPPPGFAIPSLLSSPQADDAFDEAPSLVELVTDLAVDTPLESAEAPAASSDLAPMPAAVSLNPVSLPDTAMLSPSTIAAPVAGDLLDSLGVGVAGRTGDSKQALVESKGGTRASEVAVSRALKWIVEHQNPDGTWSLIHSGGACRGRCANDAKLPEKSKAFQQSLRSGTSLALLPLLGAGQTHLEGKYKNVIGRGLAALIAMGRPDEDFPRASWMDSGRMYSHGIASIVLAEAYGLTKDPDLRTPAQAAINFIAYAQNPAEGGWRYSPQKAGDLGDVSVAGWQIMALKSAQLADLEVPSRVTERARRFLDTTQHNGGSRYAYLPMVEGGDERKPTRTLTAVGLLCRMYLGWQRDDPRLRSGIEWMIGKGPSEGNYYRNYYAAQTLFHHTGGEGAAWRAWNEPMREQLIEQQERRGHERGSWWVPGPHNGRGGRLYTTALATMTLEVYYRYLPIYRADAVDLEFPD